MTGSYISKVEKGDSDIKASMIPFLADRYDIYAETFFSEDGRLPAGLIETILEAAGYAKYKGEITSKMFMMANKAIEQGNGKSLADTMYATLKLFSEERYPLEFFGREAQRVKSGDVEEEIKSTKK